MNGCLQHREARSLLNDPEFVMSARIDSKFETVNVMWSTGFTLTGHEAGAQTRNWTDISEWLPGWRTDIGQANLRGMTAVAGGACAGLAAGVQPLSWATVSEWVLGRRQDVWHAIFEAAFLQRGQRLIASAFAQVRQV